MIIAKNQDAENSLDIYISQGQNVIIPADGETILTDSYSKETLASADDLLLELVNGNIILNDGTKDLSTPNAIDLLRGHAQSFPVDQVTGNPVFYQTSGLPANHRTTFIGAGDSGGVAGAGEPILFIVTDLQDCKSKDLVFKKDVYIKDGFIQCVDAPAGATVCMDILAPDDTYITYFVKKFNVLRNAVYKLDSEGGRAFLPLGYKLQVKVCNSDDQKADNEAPANFIVIGNLEEYKDNTDV